MEDDIKKKAGYTSTQSRYIDSSGKVFSAQDIVQGYKPKKPYKLYSLSNLIRSKGFGKVKRK